MPRTEPPPAGFTLLEVVCVCAVLAILLAVIAPAVGWQILHSRVHAETSTLQAMADAIQASFDSSDLENTNLAAIAGSVPAGVDSTLFSSSLDPSRVPGTTNAFDWFAKTARAMGYVPRLGMPPSSSAQPQLAAIVINPSGNVRFMLMGPAGESTQQRFLLISLLAAPGQLAIPPLPNPGNPQDPANLALFEDIWNTNWTNPAATLPPSWSAALTPSQVQAWQGNGTAGGHLWQLCVQRIVCPKFTITINNTHPSENCYVFYNLNGTTAGSSASVAANSGTFVISGVHSGRLIQAYRGATPPPSSQLFSQFNLRGNSEITLQD